MQLDDVGNVREFVVVEEEFLQGGEHADDARQLLEVVAGEVQLSIP